MADVKKCDNTLCDVEVPLPATEMVRAALTQLFGLIGSHDLPEGWYRGAVASGSSGRTIHKETCSPRCLIQAMYVAIEEADGVPEELRDEDDTPAVAHWRATDRPQA